MADFQHIGLHLFRPVLCKNLVLRLFFSVSRQQHSAAAVVQPQHEGIIVLRRRGNLFWNDLRPQKLAGDAIPGKGLSAELMFDWDSPLSRQFFQLR